MLKFIQKGAFSKNLITLVSGTLISHIIPLILYPFFTRLFSPADFGLFALFISIIAWIDVVSTGRYELAVIIPQEDEESMNIIAGAISFLVLIIIILYGLIFLFSDTLCYQLNNPAIKPWLLLVPPAVFVMGLSKLFNNWLIRKKSFTAIASNKIYQRIIEGISTLGFSTITSFNGLIAGDLFGRMSLAVISVTQAIRCEFRLKVFNISKLNKTISRYREYPLYNAVPALLNTGCSLLPVFLISSFYDETITGYYNLGRQMLSIPLALISINVSQVLFSHITEKRNNKKTIYGDVKALYIKLACVSLLFIAVLAFLGPLLFAMVFGKEWRTTGEYTQIMVFSFAFSFTISPLSIVLVALDKIKILSIWQIFYFVLICSLFFFRNIPIKQFLIIITLFDVVAYSAYLYLIIIVAKKYDANLVKTT